MESRHRVLMTVAVSAALTLALVTPTRAAHAQTTVGLDVEGHFSAFVTGAAGIGSEHEIIEHKVVDGSGQEIVRKIPGRLKYLDITAERGITANTDLADWRRLVEIGSVEDARANILVTLYDSRLGAIAAWNGANCWPSKIENLLPDPQSDTGAAVEKLTIVCEGLERTQ